MIKNNLEDVTPSDSKNPTQSSPSNYQHDKENAGDFANYPRYFLRDSGGREFEYVKKSQGAEQGGPFNQANVDNFANYRGDSLRDSDNRKFKHVKKPQSAKQGGFFNQAKTGNFNDGSKSLKDVAPRSSTVKANPPYQKSQYSQRSIQNKTSSYFPEDRAPQHSKKSSKCDRRILDFQNFFIPGKSGRDKDVTFDNLYQAWLKYRAHVKQNNEYYPVEEIEPLNPSCILTKEVQNKEKHNTTSSRKHGKAFEDNVRNYFNNTGDFEEDHRHIVKSTTNELVFELDGNFIGKTITWTLPFLKVYSSSESDMSQEGEIRYLIEARTSLFPKKYLLELIWDRKKDKGGIDMKDEELDLMEHDVKTFQMLTFGRRLAQQVRAFFSLASKKIPVKVLYIFNGTDRAESHSYASKLAEFYNQSLTNAHWQPIPIEIIYCPSEKLSDGIQSDLKNRLVDLKNRNVELQDQSVDLKNRNVELQDQSVDLQNRNIELQNRLKKKDSGHFKAYALGGTLVKAGWTTSTDHKSLTSVWAVVSMERNHFFSFVETQAPREFGICLDNESDPQHGWNMVIDLASKRVYFDATATTTWKPIPSSDTEIILSYYFVVAEEGPVNGWYLTVEAETSNLIVQQDLDVPNQTWYIQQSFRLLGR